MGRLRPAGRERRDQEQHAPGDLDAREHRPYEGAAPADWYQLRLGARNRDLPARLLPLEPVDLPEDARARSRLSQALERQLVPQLQDRAGERTGDRWSLLALWYAGRDSRAGTVGAPHHALRRRAARIGRITPWVAGEGSDHAAELDRAIGGSSC